MQRKSRAQRDLARLDGMPPTRIARVLETALYTDDLAAADRFYGTVLGLERITFAEGRHVFFRCGQGVVLIFDRRSTGSVPTRVNGAPVPLHGASGAGHMALAVADADLPAWRAHLEAHGVAIESEVTWPRGGRSLYVRDPAGNSVELASPLLWGFQE
jgi:catechol 2,3-dioxygenase-like lactoylglutathione lyase family enzyme